MKLLLCRSDLNHGVRISSRGGFRPLTAILAPVILVTATRILLVQKSLEVVNLREHVVCPGRAEAVACAVLLQSFDQLYNGRHAFLDVRRSMFYARRRLGTLAGLDVRHDNGLEELEVCLCVS